jgi:hypothetical protein
MITSPARADCPELRWRDGLQIAIGFDQAPTAAASIDHDGDGVPTLFVAGEGAASGIGYAGLVRLVDGRWQPFGPSFTGTVQKFERFDFDGDGVPSFILLGSLQLEVGGPWYGMLEWSGSTWIPRSADRMIDDAVVLDDDGDGTPSLIASVPYPSPAGTSPLIRWTPSGWRALTPGYTVSYSPAQTSASRVRRSQREWRDGMASLGPRRRARARAGRLGRTPSRRSASPTSIGTDHPNSSRCARH